MFDQGKSIVAGFLLIMLMMVNGLAYPNIVAHTFHHMHHTADTHASPLCSWVCTAGQMDEAASLPFIHITVQTDSLSIPQPTSPHIFHLDAGFPRGPPPPFQSQ